MKINMADSLDDFFAKKDKKRKNKSQAAALSTVALVRELEEGSKQSEYSARREGKTSAAMELLGLDANDNDWKDFEEVEKRDYSGLKVKEMSIQDHQEEEQRRLTEQSEQVPETIPWKSKLDTVAAIISAKNDPKQLAGEQTDQQQQQPATDTTAAAAAAETTTTPATATATTSSSATPASATSSKIDNTETGSTQPAGEEVTAKAAEPASAVAKEGASMEDGTKKEGDTKPVAPVKKAYVPPQERMEKDFKVLEPTRLSKLRSSSSRPGARINIEDEKAFPSLG